jgi:hypothetical protein
MPLRAEGAATGIPRAPGTAPATAIPVDGHHPASAAAGMAIATGASTAA